MCEEFVSVISRKLGSSSHRRNRLILAELWLSGNGKLKNNSQLKIHLVAKYLFSCQHWIRLEMQPDIIIHRLRMLVDPADSSYMPSLIIVSGGDAIGSLKELCTVTIGATDTLVTLLSDLSVVSHYY